MTYIRHFFFVAIPVAVFFVLDRVDARFLPAHQQQYEFLAHAALGLVVSFFAYIAWEHWRSQALRKVASEMGMQFDANGYIPFFGRRKTAISELGKAEVIESSHFVFNIFRLSGRVAIFGSSRRVGGNNTEMSEYQTVFCFPNKLREKTDQISIENWSTEVTESAVFVYKWGHRVPVQNLKDIYRDLQSQVSKQLV